MKKLLILAALASVVVFTGCDRKETVVVPSTETPATAVAPAPAPKVDAGSTGAAGATGSAGEAGAAGTSGSTTVVVPPPAAPAEAPK